MSEPAARDDIDRFAWLRPASPLARAHLRLLICLLVLSGAAWALMVYQALRMHAPMGSVMHGGVAMQGMGGMAASGIAAAGWSFGAAAIFVAVWTLMMAAMMLPSAAPMIIIFASVQAQRDRHVTVPIWLFVAGYMLVWGAAGVLVYVLVQIGSDVVITLASPDRATSGPLALGATLIVAGLYQFTQIKRVCLRHCRSPLGFMAQFWRDGWFGALGMGVRLGVYCLGCCWACLLAWLPPE